MVDKKRFSIGFLVFFIVLTVYLYDNNDKIANTIANDGSTGIFWYFVSNPAYLLLLFSIFYFNREVEVWKNVVGSVMIIVASDIISYPRFLTSGMDKELALLASSDGLVIHRLLSYGFVYKTAFMVFYLILPIVLIIGALTILGITNFFHTVFKKH